MDFFFEKLIQPGQAGIIRITIRNTGTTGPLDLSYDLYTNDPRQPVIGLKITGNIKPVPDYVKRLGNVDIAHGVQSGAFKVWPTVRPTLTLEPGERLGLSLRIRSAAIVADSLQLKSAPSDRLSYNLRREATGGGHWLDIEAGPLTESTSQKVLLAARGLDGTDVELAIQLTINVPAQNIVITPRELDLGKVSLKDLGGGPSRAGRLGIRKLAGSFQIKSITSTLDFLKLEQQEIVPGNNYLIRIIIGAGGPPRAGSYTGVIRIETDDRQTPVIEVPIKITVVSGQGSGGRD